MLNIVLHADKSLQIQKTILSTENSAIQESVTIKRDDNLQQINIEFKELILPELETFLCIEFSGQIKGNLTGFYKNTFTKNGKEHYFAMTDVCTTLFSYRSRKKLSILLFQSFNQLMRGKLYLVLMSLQ